jgi:DNA-binding CsgD family transcriptional regulator
MRPDARGAPGALPPAAHAQFEFEGRTFALVPAERWRRRNIGQGDADLKASRAVGRLDLEGERHVVVVCDLAVETEPSIAELLTRRELEVAMLVAHGKCDKEIARLLGISGYTVREHLRRTSAKLGVSRRTAIVSLVLRGLPGEFRAAARKWMA